jgi:hypothetical protein
MFTTLFLLSSPVKAPNPVRLPSMALVLRVQTRDTKAYTDVKDHIPEESLEERTLGFLQARGFNASILPVTTRSLGNIDTLARRNAFQYVFVVDVQQDNVRKSWVGSDYQTETQAIMRIIDLKHKQVIYDKTLRFGTSAGWFRTSTEQATEQLSKTIQAEITSLDLEGLLEMKYIGKVLSAGKESVVVGVPLKPGTRVSFYRKGLKVLDPETGEMKDAPEITLGEGKVTACGDDTCTVQLLEVVGRIRENDIVRGRQ